MILMKSGKKTTALCRSYSFPRNHAIFSFILFTLLPLLQSAFIKPLLFCCRYCMDVIITPDVIIIRMSSLSHGWHYHMDIIIAHIFSAPTSLLHWRLYRTDVLIAPMSLLHYCQYHTDVIITRMILMYRHYYRTDTIIVPTSISQVDIISRPLTSH